MSDAISGILSGASQQHSPNQDDRPTGSEVDLLVIHNISLPPGELGGPWIDQLFMNQLDPEAHPYFSTIVEQKVSPHLLIRRDGETIQYVSLEKRAWHAGASCFEGRECCNDYSIGIELEGTDDAPYTKEQYQALTEATIEIMHNFPAITLKRIKGHCDIAPDRKTDPGPAFDWEHYLQAVATHLHCVKKQKN